MIQATRFRKTLRPLALGLLVLAVVIGPALRTTAIHAQGGGATHTVQAGENLFRIALRYGYTVEYLAAVNGITDPTTIYVGQVLVIPDPNAPAPAVEAAPVAETAPVVEAAPAVSASPGYHIVQAGETLASIGRLYGLSWTDLATANGIANPNQIYAGQQLTIPGASGTTTTTAAAETVTTTAAVEAATAATGQRTHTVQAGEHLSAIARAYGVTWTAIAAMNNISNPNTIYTGQVLVIPAPGEVVDTTAWTQPAAAAPTILDGKQIVVDLSDQRVYAYENGQLVRNVLVSTGLWGTPTVTGDYRIYAKYDSQLMTGPGYYLPGVPWVMYFYQGYSLHGTYWHNNFGQPMSHGCVNMPTPEAQWFYNWAPIGTPVHVQS